MQRLSRKPVRPLLVRSARDQEIATRPLAATAPVNLSACEVPGSTKLPVVGQALTSTNTRFEQRSSQEIS